MRKKKTLLTIAKLCCTLLLPPSPIILITAITCCCCLPLPLLPSNPTIVICHPHCSASSCGGNERWEGVLVMWHQCHVIGIGVGWQWCGSSATLLLLLLAMAAVRLARVGSVVGGCCCWHWQGLPLWLSVSTPISPCKQWLAGRVVVLCQGGSHGESAVGWCCNHRKEPKKWKQKC